MATSPSDPPPEVLAIAVALAVAWQEARPAAERERADVSPWRWSGRRWERATSYRWS
jgi:hypothetical protein